MQSKDTFSTSDTNFFPDANLDSLFPSAITDLSDSLSHSTLFPSFTFKYLLSLVSQSCQAARRAIFLF